MVWIPPGLMPAGAFRALQIGGGLVSSVCGLWLAVVMPWGRFTVMGLVLVALGATVLRQWWTGRDA
ncbi:hypothetical protein [Streptomyces sporangiiformans]|uniref:Uncharacterized protein n=1 Tax=Streptomyces sporangiiformans TaxID=2315329 RepID=A0A505DC22_9ACTN|nr:hypothetical protein [Streptomyces sporangiiformans]TPQ22083.1 hypothetical protein FGD71_011870 [Streptomyces sporangiiformans]